MSSTGLSFRYVSKPRDVEAEHTTTVGAVLKRGADAAVDALAKHFTTTMHFVEQTAPKISEVSGSK
jgi:DNA-binding GntR family transcriptional regulator